MGKVALAIQSAYEDGFRSGLIHAHRVLWHQVVCFKDKQIINKRLKEIKKKGEVK